MKLTRQIVLSLLACAAMAPAALVRSEDPRLLPTIEIHAKRFAFVPAEITLKKGVTVRLRLVSDDVVHSLVVPGLHIRENMKVAESDEVLVTPADAGDFKGVCGRFCGDGHDRMALTIHVVDGR